MTSIADVQAVWLAEVFQNSAITAITTNILDYQFVDESQAEVEQLYKHDGDGVGEINFFEYLVENPNETIIEVGGQANPEKQFVVDVRYTKALDVAGNAENEIKAAIETIKDTVRTELGATWSTLDVKTALEIITEGITREEVNQTLCVRQVVTFRASKQ